MKIVMIDDLGTIVPNLKRAKSGAYQIIDDSKNKIFYSFVFSGQNDSKILAFARAEGFIKGYQVRHDEYTEETCSQI